MWTDGLVFVAEQIIVTFHYWNAIKNVKTAQQQILVSHMSVIEIFKLVQVNHHVSFNIYHSMSY